MNDYGIHLLVTKDIIFYSKDNKKSETINKVKNLIEEFKKEKIDITKVFDGKLDYDCIIQKVNKND